MPTSAPIAVSLFQARQGATATLLPDGTVLLWAGIGPNGGPLTNGEIFDPILQKSVLVTQMPPGAQPGPTPPGLSESLPAAGASDVPIDALLVLRFSKPLQVDTLNGTTVVLSGPGGLIAATVVPAEGGRLAFISPADVLFPGATYTLTINGPGDPSGFMLPFTSLIFTTAVAQVQPPGGPQPPGSEHGHQPIIPVPGAPPRGVPAILDDWSWEGGLKDGKPHSRWMDLPPLQAPSDVTALAGQVLRLDGEPLARVTLQYGTRIATSDATGRFLLQDIPNGYHPLLMLGHTANAPGKTYGMFEYGVRVEEKKTNVLPFTIWMPLIDTEHAIQLPGGRTQRKIIATTPKILGLEVHIPAGVTLRAPNGQLLESLSLTPIPLDRTPFPVEPGTLVFIAPQGHGTMVESHDGAMALAGAGVRVIFPNTANHPPGTKLSFRSYDAHGFGWFTLGQLTVSADGRQIAAAPGVTLGEVGCVLTLAIYRGARTALGALGLGEPVNAASGVFVHAKTDLVVPDVIPIVLRHLARSDDNNGVFRGDFGPGTHHDYEMNLEGDGQAYSFAVLPLADRDIRYTRISPGTDIAGAVMEHTTTPTRWYKSQLSWSQSLGGWEIKLTDGTRYQFVSFHNAGPKLVAIIDRLGNTLTITRELTGGGNLLRIPTPNGRWVAFTTQANDGKILSVRDNAGRQVSYQYEPITGRLWRVTDVAGGVTEYTYDNIDPGVSNRIVTIKDPRGIVYLTNQYDANGRVSRQTLADSGIWQFAYTLDGTGKVTQTDATNPRGFVTRATFNADSWETGITQALGQPEQQTTAYAPQPGTNFTNSMTDALGRQTTYTYTATGYVASVTSPGPSGPVTWSYTYEPTFNRVQTITDPLNHTTIYTYDDVARTLNITDPRGKITTVTYDTQGQPLTVKDPLNHTWTFTYDMGDLVSIKDPTGKSATAVTDAIGRPVAITDELGNRTRLDYNPLDQLTRITDPLGGPTSLGYDPNGNLRSVTDARGKVTGYDPDVMDRVQTRTDPRGKTETYVYDSNGNVRTFTDRKNQPTTITWDPLERPKQFAYADGSTTTLTWDAGDRLRQVVDSLTGTITLTPDSLDRLQQQITPQGTVSYTYDDADRRATMTVLGQPSVVYSYDTADRLTSLIQGSATVTLGYDDANRRTSLTLPNGVVATYGYSTRDELASITFKKGNTTLGTLTYTYDAAGRRATVGGTWARTGLPVAVASATYDDANRQLTWGGQAFTYDDNGNLTGDGVNTYSWDVRDHLTGISGGVAATFAYDPFGRRTRKTISAQTTDYLYDWDNPVQELSGGAVLANLLTGLGIDEYFTRTDGSGRRSLLGDALGSILALTDDAGVVQTSYTYEPFGATTVTGQSNANPFQYTGRENDGTGLYYYRARYYSPTRQRFIAQDPIGFSGGINLYAYVFNSVPNSRDPFGLDVTITRWGCCGGFDHIGIRVHPPGTSEDERTDTEGFYPSHHNAPWDKGKIEKDRDRNPGEHHKDSRTIPTTPEQDRKIQGFIDAWKAKAPGYNLAIRNCGAFVQEALRKGGKNELPPVGGPGSFFDTLP